MEQKKIEKRRGHLRLTLWLKYVKCVLSLSVQLVLKQERIIGSCAVCAFSVHFNLLTSDFCVFFCCCDSVLSSHFTINKRISSSLAVGGKNMKRIVGINARNVGNIRVKCRSRMELSGLTCPIRDILSEIPVGFSLLSSMGLCAAAHGRVECFIIRYSPVG